MKKLLFLASLMLSVTAIAGPVSQTKALNAANAFMTKHRTGVKLNVTPANSQRLNSSNQSSNQPYYVFNTVGDKGYVIVSGDDRTEEILGYVDHGSFDRQHEVMAQELRATDCLAQRIGHQAGSGQCSPPHPQQHLPAHHQPLGPSRSLLEQVSRVYGH